jgi:hypothetical protein
VTWAMYVCAMCDEGNREQGTGAWDSGEVGGQRKTEG